MSSINPIQKLSRVNILGLDFPLLNYSLALAIFSHWITERTAHQVCIANVHTTVLSRTDSELNAINRQALLTMDGLPLVWYANRVHNAGLKDRVCGPMLMLRCLDEGRAKGWRHFFLGGRDDVLNDLVSTMQARFPGIDIVGWHSPPFRPLSEQEDDDLVALINRTQPDFLWVGLGAPKQEKWIAAHLSRIHVPIQVGVGAAFDFHSGHVKRSPVWLQKAGLEWFYRILQEPRLIKRYLMTNPVFLALFIQDFINAKFRH